MPFAESTSKFSDVVRDKCAISAATVTQALHLGSAAQVLIVDEASQISEATFASLCQSCKRLRSVVLIGDRKQLNVSLEVRTSSRMYWVDRHWVYSWTRISFESIAQASTSIIVLKMIWSSSSVADSTRTYSNQIPCQSPSIQWPSGAGSSSGMVDSACRCSSLRESYSVKLRRLMRDGLVSSVAVGRGTTDMVLTQSNALSTP